MAPRKHDSKSWKRYYAATAKRTKPSLILVKAVRRCRVVGTPVAVDLGTGTGRDSLFLLKKGYSVVAIDAQASAISQLRRSTPVKLRHKLTTRILRFENIRRYHLPTFSVLNASFSIFFCRPSSFKRLWKNLVSRMEPGSLFCGQFLGLKDSWAKRRGFTAVSERELRKLFAGFTLIQMSEKEDDRPTATGTPKHWHIFTVIARKSSKARSPQMLRFSPK